VFIVVYFVTTQSGNFWIHPGIYRVNGHITLTISLNWISPSAVCLFLEH